MTEIPLFPLSSVLFPGGRMPLQIFEQRYLDLVRNCLKQDSGFGLVWITQGAEVAQPGVGQPSLGDLGTYARIVDWDSLPNGLLGITIEGGQRFRLDSTSVRDDGLVLGQVEMEPERPAQAVAERWQSLLDVLTSLEQHPHVQRLGIRADHADAWQVGSVLVQLLPVQEDLKYEMLQMQELEPFLQRLDQLLDQLGGFTA
ncbi:MAG: LON peptidase substrate-binding domain-containing protein [Gammaproteobacteria bacterium]|nr:LON peptidase substrate-binding domain-containing protein [Gammaproteobacteria bacterium]